MQLCGRRRSLECHEGGGCRLGQDFRLPLLDPGLQPRQPGAPVLQCVSTLPDGGGGESEGTGASPNAVHDARVLSCVEGQGGVVTAGVRWRERRQGSVVRSHTPSTRAWDNRGRSMSSSAPAPPPVLPKQRTTANCNHPSRLPHGVTDWCDRMHRSTDKQSPA